MLNLDKTSQELIVVDSQSEVSVGAGVEAMIVDMGRGEKKFHFGADSRVKILKVAGAEEGKENVDSVELDLERGARVETTAVFLGNHQSKVDIRGHVRDSNASSDINVIYFADRPDHFHLRVRNDFYKKDSTGEIVIRGVCANKARVEVFGEIGIAQPAGGTDSSLDQHALICGKGSKVRQLPILEINTNDVKAAHGATVSRIQDEELFYFLARGIDREQAYNLAVNGFLSVLLEQLEDFGEYHENILKMLGEKTRSLAS